ncbi:MAG: SLBB domain-containing protein [Phocaeicola sp.]|nr:SLBB domain-containing protein [Phocaeicola sp.]
MATPIDYRLGPGDEVIIDIWGANETSIKQTISPDGQIIISQVGPIYLSGLTISQANDAIRQTLSSIYSGITGDSPQSQVSITLGKIRSIQVHVMGEVEVPGTYRLSSFSTVFNAIYRAGGVSGIGSLRDIKVMRAGNKVGTVDVYDYILNGKINNDIRLQEGDVIVVPPYSMLVNVEGKIKRPMFYEMKQGETMESLINYAGGFTGDAYKEEVKLFRRNGKENRIFSVTAANYPGWQLADGDSINVSPILDRFSNRVEIQGAVYRPGMFELGNGINTVKDLIERANGLTGDAFTGRAVLTREKEDMTNEVLSIDLAGIINGTSPDVPLRREDVLFISSKKEIQAQGGISIYGEVTNPGVIPFAEKTTIEDLILKAGGLLDGASSVRVDVSRRIKDPKSIKSTEDISKVYTFAIKDGFIVDGKNNFTLEPYDIVEVRRSPGYQVQRRVDIGGEAVFTGGYTLTKKNERISDLVRRAGGLTNEAYVRGGRLIRKMNDEEKAQQEAALKMAMMNAGADSLSINKIQLSESYVVGIELDKALANPGSGYDVVLREGDYLYIPEFTSTVKITGEVQFPNTVAYVEGKKLSHYIEQAGGYSRLAKKSSVYIVHMNGTVSRVKRMRKTEIEPGCQIIVPSKKERRPITLAEIMSIGSSAASLGTMAATLYNLFK